MILFTPRSKKGVLTPFQPEKVDVISLDTTFSNLGVVACRPLIVFCLIGLLNKKSGTLKAKDTIINLLTIILMYNAKNSF